MRKMSYFVIAALALLTVGAIAMGCQSCRRSGTATDLKRCKGVPAVIADAPLMSYKYSLSGTMRWPLHSENVERCPDDSTRCIIRLLDTTMHEPEHFDENGDPLPDTLVVGSEVIDRVKQMIIEARAWQFKDDYSPRSAAMDGNSWGYSAIFAVTDSALAAAPEEKRARLLRNGGCILTSGGSNASPDTRLFEQVRAYLISVYDTEKGKQQ